MAQSTHTKSNAINLSDAGPLQVPASMKTFFSVCLLVGAVGFAGTMVQDPSRAWHAYIVGLFYFCSISLGGLFFCAIQHSTGAGWSVNVRRFAEALTPFLWVGFIASLVLLLGGGSVYKWMNPAKVAADAILQHKAPYLNVAFFAVRIVIFFSLWLIFQRILVGRSLAQDSTGDQSLTSGLVRPSVGFLIIFALSYSFFSVDLLMSLEPHWFSTIFGVYCFAGLFQSTMAAMILFILYARNNSLVAKYITEDHLHDLGKFMFAFTVFWAYIAFSQYMLIWYANMPEETVFYEARSHGTWMWVSLGLVFFRFVVPFFALLPRWAKRTPAHLAAVSFLILIMQFVDLYWLVYPNLMDDHSLKFGWQELTIFAGFLGLFVYVVMRFLGTHNLVPVKDPRIHESLAHHVVY